MWVVSTLPYILFIYLFNLYLGGAHPEVAQLTPGFVLRKHFWWVLGNKVGAGNWTWVCCMQRKILNHCAKCSSSYITFYKWVLAKQGDFHSLPAMSIIHVQNIYMYVCIHFNKFYPCDLRGLSVSWNSELKGFIDCCKRIILNGIYT